MAYIGVQPRLGNFQACDAITTSATTTFNLLVGGTAIFPQSAQHCLVSLNGVLQAPISSYTISGSTIIFAAALTTDDSIDFITILGDTLDLGVPSDSTVSLAKLTATGTKDATTFLRGDNSFATLDFKSLLSAGSGTAVSEIVFDDLDVSTYSHFMLVWFSRPATDNAFLYFQMRTGGSSGSNFTSSYYDSAVHGTSADDSFYGFHTTNGDHWRVHQNSGNAGSTEYHQSQIFFTPRKSSYQNYHGNFMRAQGTRYDASTNFRTEVSCGAYNHSDAPNATGFRIYYHSGNIEDYDYKLYGIV